MRRFRYESWIVYDYSTPPARIVCRRCQASDPIPMPIRIDVLLAWAKAFARQHNNCKEPAT